MNQLPQADGPFATADDGTTLQPSADSQPPPIASGVPAVPSSWKLAHPLTWRVFNCYCGRPVFFRNTQCLNCARPLGYEPENAQLVALEAAQDLSGQFCIAGEPGGWLYRRCANFETAARCNWLIPVTDGQNNTLCRCCRLNRIVPDQGIEANQKWWRLVEIAKRRLVSSLIALGLPVASRVSEDPVGGLAFDLLVALPGAVPVMTGHEDGIITLNVNEADDSTREAARSAMREPYRTVLGHLRHESGHYYWSRLLEISPWLEPYHAVPIVVGAILCAAIGADELATTRARLVAFGAVGSLALIRVLGTPFSLRGLGLLAQFLVITIALGILRPKLERSVIRPSAVDRIGPPGG